MTELVVLLDEAGQEVGTADKAIVHDGATPLHLAFSTYLLDEQGQVLVSRRALTKRTFPGIWTNSCCGHPGPGEDLAEAARRRVRQELGVDVADLRLVLPAFRYRAEQDGIVENEMCPVYTGLVRQPVAPDPSEVDSVTWVPWNEFRASVLDGTRVVSVWCREQVAQLPEDLLGAPEGHVSDLPPAARSKGWDA